MELKAFVSRVDTDERAIYTGMSLEIWAKLIITEQKIVQRDLLSKRADEAPDIYRGDMDF